MAGEGSLPYVYPLESVRLGSLPGFADPLKGRVISSSLNGIAVKRVSGAITFHSIDVPRCFSPCFGC